MTQWMVSGGKRHKVETHEYTGGNAYLDRVLAHFPGDRVWVINSLYGRRPVEAASEEEALEKYERLYSE